MTPQQFIREGEEEFDAFYVPLRPGQQRDLAIKSFIRSQLFSLLEELEKSMPKEEVITREDQLLKEDGEYRLADVKQASNSCRKSMLATIKKWKEGIEGKEGV